MKTFKFGQLLSKEDICDREDEIRFLKKICRNCGRAVVYGPRRFGKTSVVKNVILKDFLEGGKSFAVYADFFQSDSLEDAAMRLQVALEQALSQRVRIKTFVKNIQNYLKHFRIEMSVDPVSGAPSITLAGGHKRDEKTLGEIFSAIGNISREYDTLVVLDEFQDIRLIHGLEARLRSEIQSLNRTAVILLGSKRHLLREIFHDESKPFYGFGTDIEFKKISRARWLPYMQERFKPIRLIIKEEVANEICELMEDVPNAIQELCQWIALSSQRGLLTPHRIREDLASLIENKTSRYFEKLTSFSAKEKRVLAAIAKEQPVSAISSTGFLQTARVSATATKAIVLRLTDQGILERRDEGIVITDPIFRLFLIRQKA